MLQLPSIWAEYALFFKCACTRPPPGGFGPIYRIVSQLAQQGFIEKGLKQRPQAVPTIVYSARGARALVSTRLWQNSDFSID